jgi:PIN domain nuclease of toxin-antitoxin system
VRLARQRRRDGRIDNDVLIEEAAVGSKELERRPVAQVSERIAESRRVLRDHRIDPSDRMTLAVAASAASVTTDELLAVVEERQRRAARRLAKRMQHPEYAYMREAELAY